MAPVRQLPTLRSRTVTRRSSAASAADSALRTFSSRRLRRWRRPDRSGHRPIEAGVDPGLDRLEPCVDRLESAIDVLAKLGEFTLRGAALDSLEDDPELGTNLLQEDVGRFAPETRGRADRRGWVGSARRRHGKLRSRELRRGNGGRRVRTRGEDRRWACSPEEQRSCQDRVVENLHEEKAVPCPQTGAGQSGDRRVVEDLPSVHPRWHARRSAAPFSSGETMTMLHTPRRGAAHVRRSRDCSRWRSSVVGVAFVSPGASLPLRLGLSANSEIRADTPSVSQGPPGTCRAENLRTAPDPALEGRDPPIEARQAWRTPPCGRLVEERIEASVDCPETSVHCLESSVEATSPSNRASTASKRASTLSNRASTASNERRLCRIERPTASKRA